MHVSRLPLVGAIAVATAIGLSSACSATNDGGAREDGGVDGAAPFADAADAASNASDAGAANASSDAYPANASSDADAALSSGTDAGVGPGADAGVTLANDGGGPADTGAVDGEDAASTLTCDVFKFGAKGNGTTSDTAAIQAAIDACAAAGGGTVLAHNGTFLSGMIRLKSNIVFHLDTTATLLGSRIAADYPNTSPPTANTQRKQANKTLVYAEGVNNVRIEGGGLINGNAGAGSPWGGVEATRPIAIFTVLSQRVTIQNIAIKDSAMWDLVSMEDTYLAISGVTINSPNTANRDGMDIVDCHHVTIDNCNVTSGDDSICLKSGVRSGVDDVTVRTTVVNSVGASAIKFGTGSYGAFTNVTFDGITITGAKRAAMALESVDGADVKNITFRNITFKNVGGALLVVLGDRGAGSAFGGWPSNDVHKVGSLDTVHYENIMGSGLTQPWGSLITGTTTQRVKNISLLNVHITYLGGLTAVPTDPPEYTTQYPEINMFGNEPAFGYFVRHADGVSFTASTPTATPNDVRKAIESRDVTGMSVQ